MLYSRACELTKSQGSGITDYMVLYRSHLRLKKIQVFFFHSPNSHRVEKAFQALVYDQHNIMCIYPGLGHPLICIPLLG